MYTFLRVRNEHVLRDLASLQRSVVAAKIPSELEPYVEQYLRRCEQLRAQIGRNLHDLSLKQPSILEDVRSGTEQVVKYFDLLSAVLAIPILRASESDRLALKVVTWLHQSHPRTRRYPAAIASGGCAMRPLVQFCPVYFFPTAEQTGLLYQPLYFHEFGHLLYACHRDELDELVFDLRKDIVRILTPASYRGDRYSALQNSQRQIVERTWYHWAQEFFCDAVGLAIGGPSYLWAFSLYLSRLDQSDFHLPWETLARSTHPPTWLRIKFLHIQASAKGLSEQSEPIVKEWDDMATLMGVVEDYHGFYDSAFDDAVLTMLDDSLIEVDPRQYHASEVADELTFPEQGASPVALAHRAWCASLAQEVDYAAWENEATKRWLG